LHQIIYNPATGGCYDGMEEHNINLNQGSESTVSKRDLAVIYYSIIIRNFAAEF
jgi:hypothetical protein